MATQAAADCENKRSLPFSFAAFCLDTFIVYSLAFRICGFTVSEWFRWIAPLLQISVANPRGWYFQNLELATMVPSFAAGYIDVGKIIPAMLGKVTDGSRSAHSAQWAWAIPTVVLVFGMLRYHPQSNSLLYDNSVSALSYFFDIQRQALTLNNLPGIEGRRLLAQMSVTAPFYAGLAYSLGALTSKNQILIKLFTFKKPEDDFQPDAEADTEIDP